MKLELTEICFNTFRGSRVKSPQGKEVQAYFESLKVCNMANQDFIFVLKCSNCNLEVKNDGRFENCPKCGGKL